MAKIEVLLRADMQNLGYIGLDENGDPFDSYLKSEATEMTVEDAIKLIDKLSDKYLFKIHRNKKEKNEQIKIGNYILC